MICKTTVQPTDRKQIQSRKTKNEEFNFHSFASTFRRYTAIFSHVIATPAASYHQTSFANVLWRGLRQTSVAWVTQATKRWPTREKVYTFGGSECRLNPTKGLARIAVRGAQEWETTQLLASSIIMEVL